MGGDQRCGLGPGSRTEAVQVAERVASRVISLTNDLASYHEESTLGDVHNLVLILVECEGMTHSEARADVVRRVRAGLTEFDRLGHEDGYAEGLRSWMVGNHHWSS